ncbi:hypothetical protein CPB83DRAFT_751682, partial [Crepidotus variabilis]
MERIQAVIKDTDTPSWIESVPLNFGETAAGMLKADEWCTMSTIYLPIALISLWGDNNQHAHSDASYFQEDAYLEQLKCWVSSLTHLHPGINHRVNGHMAFHIYEFLRLFGPVRSWWCFPFERLIGHLQCLPHNHKHGQIEATMFTLWIRAARLRMWLKRPDCPPALRECRKVFDKAFG